MRPTRVLSLTALIILAVACCASDARCQGGDTLRRWGVGWDDGLGLRYLFSPSWGIGLQIKPDIYDRSSEDMSDIDAPGENLTLNIDAGSQAFRIGAMAFRQVSVGKWLGVGPYAKVGYYYGYSDWIREYETPGRQYRVDSRVDEVTFEVGVRPTFTFDQHFVLESRFGLGVIYRHTVGRQRSYYDGELDARRVVDDDTRFFVFGRDLGPGAVMQFMIYF